MKLNNNIEVSGINRIVVKKKNSVRVYSRIEGLFPNDWVDTTNDKIIEDKHMCNKIRKMVKQQSGNWCMSEIWKQYKYRVWIHNETLNLEVN